MEHLEKRRLLHDIQALGADYLASVIAAELVDRGVAVDSIFFRNESTFRRAVAKDIADISWNTDGSGADDLLLFDLNREGIYDMLPEAMVHTQGRKQRSDDAAYKHGRELRRQEREARKFFSPLENEFHHRSLRLELTERELIEKSNPRRNREFFNYFFEDGVALSDQQLLVLLYILPLSHKIRGDADLIGLCVSRILGCEARVVRRWTMHRYQLPASWIRPLGAGTLGADTVLHERCDMPIRRFELHIDNLQESDYKDYTGKGKHLNVLHFILPYFFPATAEYRIVLNPAQSDARLKTGDAEAHSYLGFNSYI